MKFGASSYIWAELFGAEHFDVLPRLKEGGFDGIEIGVIEPAIFPARAVRKELEKSGLECTTCGTIPNGASLISHDPELRRKARTHVQDCIKATADLGGRIFCGPIYSPVGYFSGRRRTPDEWKWGVESWKEIAPLAAQHQVTVAIEPLNRFETYFLNTAADAAKFCDEIAEPNVGVLVDTFHANIEEKSIGAALHHAGRHLKHIHSSENDRGTPGTGNVNWTELFAAIKAMDYGNWMVIESFGFSLGAVAAAASIWRDIERTPESIAFDGVKFLREGTSGSA